MANWETVVDSEEEFMALVRPLVETGKIAFQSTDAEDDGFVYIELQDGPMMAVAVVSKRTGGGELVDSYPLPVERCANELEVVSVDPVEDDAGAVFEGNITAITQDGTQVTFTCPLFLREQARITEHPRFRFGLAAMARTLQKAPQSFEVTEGAFFEHEKRRRSEEDPNFDPESFKSVEVQMGELRCFMDREGGDLDFTSVVESVRPFTSLGKTGLILTMNLVPEDRAPLRISVYATDRVLAGYTPVVGDLVSGIGWLQGVPEEMLEVDRPWLDSAEAANHGGADDGGFLEMMMFMESSKSLPIALQSVGSGFAGAGWEVRVMERNAFRDYLPMIWAERGSRRLWIFVRCGVEGFCEPPEWRQDDVADRVAKLAEDQGFETMRLTVRLSPCGERHYDVAVEGLGDLDGQVRTPLSVVRPEFYRVVDLDKIGQEDPPPIFDEAVAAATFARCANSVDLEEFAAMLVEDAELISDPARACVRGRLSILSYLGNRLDCWREFECSPVLRVGNAVIDGRRRACTLLFAKGEDKPNNCTVFDGRDGRVCRLRAYIPSEIEFYEVLDQS